MAEAHGLEVEHHPKYGWTITSPGIDLLDFIEQQGWQDLQMVEGISLLDVLGTLPKGSSGAGAETRTKSPAVPANIFVQNVATAAERPRSST